MSFDRNFPSPWQGLIKCGNCNKSKHRFTVCYLWQWKKVYLCPTCVSKFNKVMDDKGVEEYSRGKYFVEYKTMTQNAPQ